MTNLDKALLDPTIVYGDPREVVSDEDLTRDQKVEILRRWEYDAHELEVAEEEAGMAMGRPELLERVIEALHALGVVRDTEHTPPTK